MKKDSNFIVNYGRKRDYRFLKESIDFWVSLIGLSILAIPFAIIALAIKLDSKGPVFFRSDRVSKDGKIFRAYKFRSMIKDAMSLGLGVEVAKDDFRITRLGRFLRNWSLDELPQLINVLRGEMSLIGPRPALPHQVEKYSEYEKKRLTVKPGMTGWAQVNGRNLISWNERIIFDIWYVENWSLRLDFKILLKTPEVILFRKGLYGRDGMVRDYE